MQFVSFSFKEAIVSVSAHSIRIFLFSRVVAVRVVLMFVRPLPKPTVQTRTPKNKALVLFGLSVSANKIRTHALILARQSALPATVHLRKKLVGLRDSMAAASKAAAVSEAEQSGRLQRFKNVIRPAVFLQVFNA